MIRAVAAAGILLGLACIAVSKVDVRKATGDRASIALKSGWRGEGELLAVSDSNLYLASDALLLRSPLAEVERVRVGGYSLRAERVAAAVIFGVSQVVLTVLAVEREELLIAALVGGMVAVTIPIILGREPRVDFVAPLRTEDLGWLALHCRYRQNLTDEQWLELLEYHHQAAFYEPWR